MISLPRDRDALRTFLAREMSVEGRSQAALSKRLGVHQSAISRILSGDRRVKMEEIPLIEAYLSETAEGSSNRIVIVNPELGTDDLGAGFDDIIQFLGDSLSDPASLEEVQPSDVKNDYEFVIRSTAKLSVALHRCALKTANETQDEELREIVQHSWRLRIGEKIGALVRVGRLHPSEGTRLASIFAIRDVFIHSLAPVRLGDPRLALRMREVMKVDLGNDSPPEFVRTVFSLGAMISMLRLQEVDPKETSSFLRELADGIEADMRKSHQAD